MEPGKQKSSTPVAHRTKGRKRPNPVSHREDGRNGKQKTPSFRRQKKTLRSVQNTSDSETGRHMSQSDSGVCRSNTEEEDIIESQENTGANRKEDLDQYSSGRSRSSSRDSVSSEEEYEEVSFKRNTMWSHRKEKNRIRLTLPPFDSSNYAAWRERVLDLFSLHEVDSKKQQLQLLLPAILEGLISIPSQLSSSEKLREVWNKLDNKYSCTPGQRLFHLTNFRIEAGETAEEALRRLETIAGERYKEDFSTPGESLMRDFFLRGLPAQLQLFLGIRTDLSLHQIAVQADAALRSSLIGEVCTADFTREELTKNSTENKQHENVEELRKELQEVKQLLKQTTKWFRESRRDENPSQGTLRNRGQNRNMGSEEEQSLHSEEDAPTHMRQRHERDNADHLVCALTNLVERNKGKYPGEPDPRRRMAREDQQQGQQRQSSGAYRENGSLCWHHFYYQNNARTCSKQNCSWA